MKFRLLLWYMARRMDMLARTNAEFISRLHGRDFVLQISSDEHTQRYFHIHRNRVESHAGLHPQPDLTLHFASNALGLRLMTRGSAQRFMEAVQKQQVKMTGDMALLMWFMGIGKYLRPGRRGRGVSRDSGAARPAG
ncbi:MAG: SCP2 sterol-binding domain-containing protein [Pseudomonadota bacterium]